MIHLNTTSIVLLYTLNTTSESVRPRGAHQTTTGWSALPCHSRAQRSRGQLGPTSVHTNPPPSQSLTHPARAALPI
jgi:hypothetical protein